MAQYIQSFWYTMWSGPRSILPGSASADFSRFTPVVVITGCDSGIAKPTYTMLQERGFEVVGVCEKESSLEQLRDAVALATTCDISKTEEIDALQRRVESFLQANPQRRLWGVVNNAGTNILAPIDWVPVSEFDRLMRVNFTGMVDMTKHFLPLLKRTKGSRVVNVASVVGHLSPASFGAYAPTKAAIQSFTKALAEEMAQFGVYACIVNPMPMDTPMIQHVSDGALELYENLPLDLKEQYPRDEAHKYIENVANATQSVAQDPVNSARTLVLALEQDVPKFEYMAGHGASATWLWKHLVPQSVEQAIYRTKSVAIPTAIPPSA